MDMWYKVTEPRASYDSYIVQSRYGVCPILALNDGLLVQSVPVLKLGVQLDGDDLKVARIMIPGEIAVHTHHIYIGCLHARREKVC